MPRYVQQYPELLDFYNEFDELDITLQDVKTYEKFLKRLDDDERELLDSPVNLYFVDFHNLGGLVMPVIVQIEFEDGSRQTMRYPAEVWTRNNQQITKLIATEKTIKSLTLDPRLETADGDTSNNHFPARMSKSRFKLFKERTGQNPMQEAQGKESDEDDEDQEGSGL